MELRGDVLKDIRRRNGRISRNELYLRLLKNDIDQWSINTLKYVEYGITRFPDELITDLVRIGLVKEGGVDHLRLRSAHPGPLREKRFEDDEVIQTFVIKIVVLRKPNGEVTLEARP